MSQVDYYEALQVHQKAELDVIRAAFRTLARKYHPDAGGTGARMASLNEAWFFLGDPKRRAAYDAAQAGEAAAQDAAASHGTVSTDSSSQYAPRHTARRDDSGRVLDFGRYTGWSLTDLARHDPVYLEWLARTPIGRPLRAEIQTLLGEREAARSGGSTGTAVRTPFRLRRRGR